MNTPVNLNKVRKARARAEKRARADENAVKFGRSKAEKDRDRMISERAVHKLDQRKRDET